MESKDLTAKGNIQDIKVDMADLRRDIAKFKSEMLRAMMLQTFAIAGLVIAVVKFMN